MAQHSDFDYAEQEGFQLLALPYRGGDLEMVVLLPREPDGLRALEDRLTAESLLQWRHAARSWDVIVHLPRFRIEHAFQANPLLASLGMTDVFDSSADLSGMIDDAAGRPRLLVSDVIHQAFIEVNEEGTEAAAATVVIVALSSPHQPPPPVEFRADRPFLFLIRDARHDTILFLGRLTGP
jgi:serpin B